MGTELRESGRGGPASAAEVELDDIQIGVDLREDVQTRIGSLQDELDRASDEEAAKRREIDLLRSRQRDLMTELREKQDEAGRLILEEAAKMQRALSEEAERHAARIKRTASEQTTHLIAEARERAAEIVDEGRARLEALEAEVTQREAKLELEHEVLDRRTAALRRHHEQMVETLKLVAEIALEQVAQTQESARHLYATASDGSSVIGTEIRSMRGE